MKIHILGGAGSGKSFIAQKLAERYGIPVLELDDIFWNHAERNYGSRAEPETRDSALEDFVAQDKWIVEGAYYRWCAPSFQAADWIFVLTSPLWLRQVRIVRRFFRRKIGLDHGKKETFRGQMELMSWNRKFDSDNLVRAKTMLKELALPFTECSTLEEVLNYTKNSPNNAVDSTATRITPPASALRSVEEARHGQP